MSRKKRLRDERVTMPIKNNGVSWGRNWMCACGSKKKFKNCCLLKSRDWNIITDKG